MARRDRVRFSHEHLDIEQIDGYRRDTEAAIESTLRGAVQALRNASLVSLQVKF